MKMKKSILLLLLFCLFSFPCISGEVSKALKDEILRLEELEQNYRTLESAYETQTIELNNSRTASTKLSTDLEILTANCERIMVDFEKLSQDYKSLQTKSNILKIGCITLGITTAVAVPLLIWSFNRKE